VSKDPETRPTCPAPIGEGQKFGGAHSSSRRRRCARGPSRRSVTTVPASRSFTGTPSIAEAHHVPQGPRVSRMARPVARPVTG